jgi:hypothetical protein
LTNSPAGQRLNYEDHCIDVGRLWGSLQSLEVTLRLFLTQANPSTNYITKRAYFRELVSGYNGQLSGEEQSLYSVDMSIVTIRNAIAHGLVSGGSQERFPLTLFHPASGLRATMTMEWFNDQISLAQEQIDRISACGKERWPKSRWWG